MQINVSQLLKASIGARRDYEVSETIDIAGGNSLVRGEVGLMRTDRGIWAKGTLHTEVEATCNRCLSLFGCPLVLDITEEYFPVTDVASGTSVSLPDESGCFTIDEHHTLDLTEAIRQYGLLATPTKTLCRQDCAGLCPVCGRNLNEGPCNCRPRAAEHQQSGLSKLALAGDLAQNEWKGME